MCGRAKSCRYIVPLSVRCPAAPYAYAMKCASTGFPVGEHAAPRALQALKGDGKSTAAAASAKLVPKLVFELSRSLPSHHDRYMCMRQCVCELCIYMAYA